MAGDTKPEQGADIPSSRYDQKEVEAKWQRYWKDEKVYRFDFESDAPIYSIDNPPRYASGALHAGHAVNYTQIDFAARYHRMLGKNVFFPLCFDTNGTPIEVKVERKHNVTLDEIDRHEFIKLCREFANSHIEEMTRQFEILGESMDPEIYYQTDAEYYRRLTQISFVQLYKRGLIYKGEFPINWCPRCMTAIADAEVEYQHRQTKFNYIQFGLEDSEEKVTIATTRPELLCTCQLAAVHPEDEKNAHLIGKRILTPIYNKPVEVVADDKVDPSFGTGIVMICTIGDKDDLEWVYRYKLPLEAAIDKKGNLLEIGGKYAGMSIPDAKKAIISDMKEAGLLVKQEELDQNVGMCWRCSTPIEFLQVPQWFLKILDFKEDVLRRADDIKWFPEYMKLRLREWVNSLAWDWAISRQRYFATPIPLWECEDCGEVILAEDKDCYVDPTLQPSPREKCEICGGIMKGCTDVFDTWMDSSISPLFNSFWQRDEERFRKLYPMSLRPQAQDIIRTWAYYTILREHLLVDERPWDDIMIGAYILAPDGTPMHASKGNAVDPLELLEEFGSDPVRYWAALCGLGEDSPVNFKDLRRGQKLCTKFWNVQRFINSSIKERPTGSLSNLRTIDRWILSRYSRVLKEVSQAMDNYAYDKAVKSVEYFIWHELADHYLELVKQRAVAGERAVQEVLYVLGLGTTKMLAPVLPHLTEEIFDQHYKRFEEVKSIHLAPWPVLDMVDEGAEASGEVVKDVVAAVRSWKSENGLALNTPLPLLEVLEGGASAALVDNKDDLISTLRVEEFGTTDGQDMEEVPSRIKPVHSKLGPIFKSKAKEIVKLLSDMDPAHASKAMESGKIELPLQSGEVVELTGEFIEIETSHTCHGREVDTLKVGDVTVILGK